MSLKDENGAGQPAGPITIRPLVEPDLPEARRIFHLAFGTFLGLPDPMQFIPDRDFVRGRYIANPEGALAAEAGGELAGSNFATRWGSVGFFGPLTIRPDYWDRGVAKLLLERTVHLFEKWQIRHSGLFTFPHSPKHVNLYQKFGFWPGHLTAIMSRQVAPGEKRTRGALYSSLPADEQHAFLEASRRLADSIHPGLDPRHEIHSLAKQKLGEIVIVSDNTKLTAFAICHCGQETEAGVDTCYLKFGAARDGGSFEHLLDACEDMARGRGLSRLEAGVNTARLDAYRRMLARGFRTQVQGVALHKGGDPGYNRRDVYVMDDWR